MSKRRRKSTLVKSISSTGLEMLTDISHWGSWIRACLRAPYDRYIDPRSHTYHYKFDKKITALMSLTTASKHIYTNRPLYASLYTAWCDRKHTHNKLNVNENMRFEKYIIMLYLYCFRPKRRCLLYWIYCLLSVSDVWKNKTSNQSQRNSSKCLFT